MGAKLYNLPNVNFLFISGIAYKSDLASDVNEFIEIANAGSTPVDISGYAVTKGVTFTFPQGSMINSGESVYIVYDSSLDFWTNKDKKVYQWESGRLADEGEAIQLETDNGIVVDKVKFMGTAPWPEVADGEGIKLKSTNMDNHFGENWKAVTLDVLVSVDGAFVSNNISVYPNPTHGVIRFSGIVTNDAVVDIFDIAGVKQRSEHINISHPEIDLSDLNQGVYFIRSGNLSQKLILIK